LLGAKSNDLGNKGETAGDGVENKGSCSSVSVRVDVFGTAKGAADLREGVADTGSRAYVPLRVSRANVY
jgi:hypothetical protein